MTTADGTPARTVIGVLGGMGPAATAEFLALLAAETPARTDADHFPALILSDPQIPSRPAALAGSGPSPLPAMLAGLDRLAGWGADLLAVPCNTAHVFLDEASDRLPLPLVHIVDSTLDEARHLAPEGAWLLGTDATVRSRMFQQRALRSGYDLLEPAPAVQADIDACAAAVKARALDRAVGLARGIEATLRRTADRPAVLACTELPLAWDAAGLGGRSVSSLGALARATVAAAQRLDAQRP